MDTKANYRHSAYWYASRYGWTQSDASSYTGAYLDFHTYSSRAGAGKGDGRRAGRDAALSLDTNFNPLMFGVCIAMDIGVAVRRDIQKIRDPVERDRIRRELMRDLRSLRRPFYYARETERRRRLAAERRKLARRTTLAQMPTSDDLLEAWNRRKESKENMIVLGGMLHDLECYVDNRLRFDEDGMVVGRNRGIRGWIACNLPELLPKYKTLMRYKAMAIRLRQATKTKDPKPTSHLLKETPRHEVVETILGNSRTTFSSVEETLEYCLSPEMVLKEKPPEMASTGGTEYAVGRRTP